MEPRIRDEIGAIAVLAFALLSTVALATDQGAVLQWWRSALFAFLGWAAWLVPLALGAIALELWFGFVRRETVLPIVGGLVVVLALLGLTRHYVRDNVAGGFVGGAVAKAAAGLFGQIGAPIALGALLLVGVVIAANRTMAQMFVPIWRQRPAIGGLKPGTLIRGGTGTRFDRFSDDLDDRRRVRRTGRYALRAQARSRGQALADRGAVGRPRARSCRKDAPDRGAHSGKERCRDRDPQPGHRAGLRPRRCRKRGVQGLAVEAHRGAREGRRRRRDRHGPGQAPAPPDRGADRLWQERLHRRDPHEPPPAVHPRRRADPDRGSEAGGLPGLQRGAAPRRPGDARLASDPQRPLLDDERDGPPVSPVCPRQRPEYRLL